MASRHKWSFSKFAIYFILLFSLATTTSACDEHEKAVSYLEVAEEMIEKAKRNLPHCPEFRSSNESLDCTDVLKAGHGKSGVYTIWPKSRALEDKPMEVYCDMDTDGGGWTVIQRRGNFSRSKDYFFKDWTHYKNGFGDIEKDFWLGNDNMFAISNQRQYSIRFDLQDMLKEKRYALYDSFWVDGESAKYVLHVDDYSGDAGDGMADANGQKFTTKDQDNDNHKDNCAVTFKGGWWYNACHSANLNGQDFKGPHESYADGINWQQWKGYKESLYSTEMKIRPKNFKKNSNTQEKSPNEHEFETPRF